MKIFGKRSSRGPAENALPGVFALFEQVLRTIGQDRALFAGYAAWALIPALASFGLSYVTLTPVWNTVVENAMLVVNLVLTIWVHGTISLLAMSRMRGENLREQDLSFRVRKAMPMLIYVFGFSFFCVIVGAYLFFIPGIIAWVLLAFTSLLPLDRPTLSFSQTLRESAALSKHRFFSVFWRMLVGEAIFGVLFLLLAILVLGALFALLGIDPQTLLPTTITPDLVIPAWLSLLISALFLPFLPYSLAYTVALYEALKKA